MICLMTEVDEVKLKFQDQSKCHVLLSVTSLSQKSCLISLTTLYPTPRFSILPYKHLLHHFSFIFVNYETRIFQHSVDSITLLDCVEEGEKRMDGMQFLAVDLPVLS